MRSAEILLDVVATPISPELLPSGEEGGIAQHTEKLVGPYELHDFFLYHFIQNGYSPAKILFAAETAFDGRYDRATILRWMRVFFQRFFSRSSNARPCPTVRKLASSPSRRAATGACLRTLRQPCGCGKSIF